MAINVIFLKSRTRGRIDTTVNINRLSLLFLVLPLLAGCSPTVKVQAPDKPIEINMNINIRHEILVKVEREVEEMFENEAIF